MKLTFCCFEVNVLFSFAVTTFPVNTTALPCQTANFTCTGIGDFFNWIVNEVSASAPDNAGRGLDTSDDSVGQNLSGTLIVPANGMNDNVAVECFIIMISAGSVFDSPSAYLSVEGK